MTHHAIPHDQLPYEERGYRPQDAPRQVAALTDPLGLEHSRASIWRYPPGARGRRHIEHAQEEVFVVLEGTITIMVGEPPEPLELTAGGVASVSTGTPLQVRNESVQEARLLVWGAPPERGKAELLDDLP
jgi:mannose-6-phosphate isomerase-like protein (cupin superfamily)